MHSNSPLTHVPSAAWPFQGGATRLTCPEQGRKRLCSLKPGWEVWRVRIAKCLHLFSHNFTSQGVGMADQILQFSQSKEKTPLLPLRLRPGGWLLCAGKTFGTREVRNKKPEGLSKEEGSEKVEEKNRSEVCVLAETL